MRSRLLRLSTAPVIFALAMLLAGCGQLRGLLGVDLKRPLAECRKLDPRVPGPGSRIGPDTDYRKLSAEALADLRRANDGTARRNVCEDTVVEKYAGDAK